MKLNSWPKVFLTFLLVLTVNFPVWAKWKQEIDGSLKSSSQSYFQTLSSETDDFIQVFNGVFDYNLKTSQSFQFNSKLFTRFNTSTNSSHETDYADLQEAYLQWKAYPFKIEVGNHIYNWGLLEGHSVLNVVNQNAVFDPLSPIPVGSPSIDLMYEKNLFTLSMIYIPKQTKAHFPGPDSRWLPRKILVTGAEASQFTLPSTLRYSYPRDTELDDALENNFGIRSTLRSNDWDIYLQHFEGASNTPKIQVFATSFGFVLDSDIALVPVYYRHRSSGLGLVWAPGDYLVRFESAYTHSISKDASIDSWSSQNGLGFEKTYSLGESSLTSVFQIYYSNNPSKADNLASSSYRLFDESALLSLLWSPDTETALMSSLLYSSPQKAHFLILSYTTQVLKNTKAGLNISSFEGDKKSLLGAYNKNDRAELTLEYLF